MNSQALKLTKRYPLVSFFVLSYLFSWAMWDLERRFWSGSWLSWGGLYGPALSAVLLATVNGGRDGLLELLTRMFVWRVSIKWYLIAILLIPVAAVAVVAVYALTGSLVASLPGWDFWLATYPQHLLLAAAVVTLGIVILAGPRLGRRQITGEL